MAVFYEVLRKTLCHSRLFQPLSASFASVLGAVTATKYGVAIDLDTFNTSGVFLLQKAKTTNAPEATNDLILINHYGNNRSLQIVISTALNTTTYGMFIRVSTQNNASWGNWYRFTLTQ